MLKFIKKKILFILVIGLCAFSSLFIPAQLRAQDTQQIKELNFVFLHGAGGNTCTFQLMEEYLIEKLPEYSLDYERENYGTSIEMNVLKRCYPGYVDVESWANNIADSIDKYFVDKENLILIGHSMGGKSALYAVAHNIGGLADKVSAVITINSPVKNLSGYYIAGGGSVQQYLEAAWFWPDEGIGESVAYYDSSADGKWIGNSKHWLAFISGEDTPVSELFDVSGIDAWPRELDDSIVPVSAQYSDGADVIYYGTYGHSEFSQKSEVTEFMVDQILRYIFGGYIKCSVFSRGGILGHEAGWLPGTDRWEDVVGGIPASSGTITHKNNSFFKWQEWEDTVGECPAGAVRDSFYFSQKTSFPVLTGVAEARWFNSDNTGDCRLYIRTRVAPRNSIQVNWSIHKRGLLPQGIERDHYEIQVVSATLLTAITNLSWETNDTRDLRILIASEAERPFRWFKLEWKVFHKEARRIRVIDDIPAKELSTVQTEG